MARVGIRKFIDGLQKSDLVPIEQLRRVLNECREDNNGPLSNPEEVADYLVDRGHITSWHRQKLLSGKYRGFYLGDYKLLGHLGTGGMSTVYLAEHLGDGSKRAIKVLPRKRVTQRSYLERFRHEAEATARLNHPNIVKAYGIGQDNDAYFIVMEYIAGDDVSNLVKDRGPLEIIDAVRYTAQIARALHYAHGQGIVHRDIKPGNFLVDLNGEAKLLDLGLAMSREQDESITQVHNERVLGTADYLSPEQAINSHKVDQRTDIYSLGCSLYFMLTGHPPFPVGTLAQRIAMHQSRRPADVIKRRPDCPPEIKEICDKMMKKKPEARFQDCQQVFEELARWLASKGETVTGTMYATLATPGSAMAGHEGGPLDGDSTHHELSAETKALVQSLEVSSGRSSSVSESGENLVFLPSSSDTAVDAQTVDVLAEESSVLRSRMARQSGVSRRMGWRMWAGVFAAFLALLLILILVVSMSI